MNEKKVEFYKQRRVEKHRQRQKKQFKQLGVATALFLFGTLVSVALISKPSVAKVKSTIEKPIAHQSNENILVANSGSLKLLLPIPSKKLTAVGFHEAFNPQAISLKPEGTQINAKKMSKNQVYRLKQDTKGLIYSLMWRTNRSGPLNSSVDIGSKPGTINHSPVSGRVVQIRKYQLYGRIPDVEVHILPDKDQDRHLVIIHMNDIQVKAGDRVIAGLTPVGRTRQLSKFFRQQLSDYSKDSGDHVHYQVNKLVNGKCHQD